jgi:DNA-directed RNA polymerase, subunit L
MADVSIATINDRNDVTFKVKDEDISVLYIVKHELVKMDHVNIAGVAQRHYLINEYEFRVNTDSSKDPFDAVKDAINTALSNVRRLKEEVVNSLNKQ